MREGLVSIVLPIYGVEKYLDRCINSVVNQTYPNLEIILVDDGSPDNCPYMCDAWAKKDCRIQVIHKENAGQGMARNTGIEHAHGEYICFVDSDDYIALDTVEKCIVAAKKNDADVVLFGFNRVSSSGEISESIVPKLEKLHYQGEEIREFFLPALVGMDPNTGKICNLSMSISMCFYSMNLIRRTNWRVVSEREIISEDVFSLLLLYSDVKKATVIPEALYYYCLNLQSFTHTYRCDQFDKIKYFYDECTRVCDQLGYSDNVKSRLPNCYFDFTIAALKLIASSDCSDKKEEMIKILSDQHLKDILAGWQISFQKKAKRMLFWSMKHNLHWLSMWMIKMKAK